MRLEHGHDQHQVDEHEHERCKAMNSIDRWTSKISWCNDQDHDQHRQARTSGTKSLASFENLFFETLSFYDYEKPSITPDEESHVKNHGTFLSAGKSLFSAY